VWGPLRFAICVRSEAPGARQSDGLPPIAPNTSMGCAECLFLAIMAFLGNNAGDAGTLWRRSLVSLECPVKAVDKTLPMDFKGLMQQTNGSGMQRSRPNGLVRISCYEDDRNVKAETGQMILQLDAAHVRHLDIQYLALCF
jgi:hypothetical protein